jgi:Tfp pilus assembly PilM family ATPase/Tfp pilus assembly protein FimT
MIRRSDNMSPIGIDIDHCIISAVQLALCEGGWRIAAAAVLPRVRHEWPPHDAELQRLGDVLARQGFKGNRVSLAVPETILLSGMLDAPPASSGAPIDQIACMELARIHKQDPEKLESHCWELPVRHRSTSGADAKSACNLMAVGCAIDQIVPLLDSFEGLHWDVQRLSMTSWALAKACSRLAGGAASCALVNIGWAASTLSLVHRGVIVYQRSLEEAGLLRLRKQVEHALGCPPEVADVILGAAALSQAPDGELGRDSNSRRVLELNRLVAEHLRIIVQEVRTSCSYLGHRFLDSAPRDLVVAGPGANLPGAIEILSRGLEMKVKAATPKACLLQAAVEKDDQPALAAYRHDPALIIALGLAMSHAAECASRNGDPTPAATTHNLPSFEINLIPKARRMTKHRRQRKRMWATVIGTYALSVLICILGSRLMHVFDSRALASQVELLQSQIDMARNEAKSLRTQLKQVRDAWETANTVNNQPDWSLLLALLADIAGDDIELRMCEIGTAMGNMSTREIPPPAALPLAGADSSPSATSANAMWTLNLSGRARSQAAVSQFVLRLEHLGLFAQVRLMETRREPLGQGAMDDHFVFFISCTMD